MSAYDVEKCITDYLSAHDGSAPAGEVTAHAIAAGHAKSTVHRVAERIVKKDRTGNTFAWSLKPRPVYAPSPARPDAEISSRVGRMIDTRKKPSLWDAMSHNGQTMRPDTNRVVAPAPASVPQRDPADVADPEHVDYTSSASTMDSRYARMSQAERLHLLEERHGPDDYSQLTEVEAVVWLEQEDDPVTSPRAHRSSALPF